MTRLAFATILFALGCAGASREAARVPAPDGSPPAPAAERPVHMADNAPADQPWMATTDTAAARLFALLEPCRRVALAAWPEAKRRFAAGLPPQHTMFVTARLRDRAGRAEQVFVAVDAIDGGRVAGRLWSDVGAVEGYRRGQPLSLAEAEVVDWMVARPDGTEEGNWMGRFIDAYQATGRPPAGVCGP